jgi:hypothetical protein
MSQPRVACQSTGIVLKPIAAALGGDLFARCGVPLPPIVDALPTAIAQQDRHSQPGHLVVSDEWLVAAG